MILGIPSRPGLRVMVAPKPVDFRKGMEVDSLGRLRTLPGHKAARGWRIYLAAGAGWRCYAEHGAVAPAIFWNGLDTDSCTLNDAGKVNALARKNAQRALIIWRNPKLV
jgi:hypothetical protein